MNQVKLSGNIGNMQAVGIADIAFDLKAEGCTVPCIIEGEKGTIFYNLLIEGDRITVSGEIIERQEKLHVNVTDLEKT